MKISNQEIEDGIEKPVVAIEPKIPIESAMMGVQIKRKDGSYHFVSFKSLQKYSEIWREFNILCSEIHNGHY